ncbi:MAG: double-strand break repair helicase AddA [Pseudomonadota bacterium]
MSPDDATRAQIDAALPETSTWLGANAGSGKTRVLTDRVARLLFQGVQPQQILCLTYTKAAASEMQNRLFKRLGAWSMQPDVQLRDALRELGITAMLDDAALKRARRLFALAIETPGGLKIQTIHSFCAGLLRRFPLEARVNPEFTEMEDRAADLLRDEVLERMADGPEAALISNLALFYTTEDFAALTRKIVTTRSMFQKPRTRADVLADLGQPASLTAAQIEASVFLGSERTLLDAIVPHLIAKGGNDGTAGRALQALGPLDLSALPQLETVFLTKSGKNPFTAKIGSFPTKPTQTVIGADLEPLEAFMQRVEDAREARLALDLAQKTVVLHQFAQAFLDSYERAKQDRGWLDFDDLIFKARALLSDSKVAAWVLYRIDGGIDHILVDEAQDTSPDQWTIIERLTDEFTAGAGARASMDRTLFVVGDKKQSIYSFQGADTRAFDEKAALFEEKIKESDNPFQKLSLDYSFRSSSAILTFVDTVFDPAWCQNFDPHMRHIAFKKDLPGRVDLWPATPKAETEAEREWTDPIDLRSDAHHTVILAQRIADEIHRLTQGENYIPDDGPNGTIVKRRIRPGDFLILVQRRQALFAEIIRACKARGLEIAGADRLKVGGEIAVKDIAALLSFLATPDDSLSLATALRSPLFGWSEQEIFERAHRRSTQTLWADLRDRGDQYAENVTILKDLRAQVDFLRPYDLIERILTRHGARKRLLARLGPEAEDGINALLGQALSFERNTVPSLTGFIQWMETDALEIKRQVDSASNQIRVMTVHGSKGLEAPIVILPDSAKRDVTVKSEFVTVKGGALWKPSAAEQPAAVRARIEVLREAEQAERLRLLYVAMTRAEKWLIFAAAGDVTPDERSWYALAEGAMHHLGGTRQVSSGVHRYEEGDWNGLPVHVKPGKTIAAPALDDTLTMPAAMFSHADLVLSPSDLGGAKALVGKSGASEDDARAFGTLVHEMIEALADLPPEDRAATAQKIWSEKDAAIRETAWAEVQACLAAPELAEVFAPGSFAEVPVTATVAGTRLHGVIDRMIVTQTAVRVIDYKTNRRVPQKAEECPEGILRQMGAYAAILREIYPRHEIETAILWTSNASLMPLPGPLTAAALARSAYLDAAQAHS